MWYLPSRESVMGWPRQKSATHEQKACAWHPLPWSPTITTMMHLSFSPCFSSENLGTLELGWLNGAPRRFRSKKVELNNLESIELLGLSGSAGFFSGALRPCKLKCAEQKNLMEPRNPMNLWSGNPGICKVMSQDRKTRAYTGWRPESTWGKRISLVGSLSLSSHLQVSSLVVYNILNLFACLVADFCLCIFIVSFAMVSLLSRCISSFSVLCKALVTLSALRQSCSRLPLLVVLNLAATSWCTDSKWISRLSGHWSLYNA